MKYNDDNCRKHTMDVVTAYLFPIPVIIQADVEYRVISEELKHLV